MNIHSPGYLTQQGVSYRTKDPPRAENRTPVLPMTMEIMKPEGSEIISRAKQSYPLEGKVSLNLLGFFHTSGDK